MDKLSETLLLLQIAQTNLTELRAKSDGDLSGIYAQADWNISKAFNAISALATSRHGQVDPKPVDDLRRKLRRQD